MKNQKILVVFLTVLVVVQLACSFAGAPEPTATPLPLPTNTVASTATPEPTATETSTPRPTRAHTATATPFPAFFREDMERQVGTLWNTYIFGDSSKNSYRFRDGELLFSINESNAGIEFIYTPYNYSDVRIDAVFDNKPESRNTINVTLLCRVSAAGFYQVWITNDGRYGFQAYDSSTEKSETLFQGASLAINQGKATNEYGLQCKGNKITLFINGQEIKTVEENKVGLDEGTVGIYVGAVQTLVPVIVGVDWIEISEP